MFMIQVTFTIKSLPIKFRHSLNHLDYIFRIVRVVKSSIVTIAAEIAKEMDSGSRHVATQRSTNGY